MGSLNKNLLPFKEKPWLVSLVCTVFVAYPNIAWFLCDLEYFVPAEERGTYFIFFLFRFFYYWGLIGLLIRYNLCMLLTLSLLKRVLKNVLFTVVGFIVYKLILHFTHDYDHFISIVIFQYLVVCLLCSALGYIYWLYAQQRQKDLEIERLRVENLQSRCDALTNQINPHFFFNSLNGISALIRKKNTENALTYVSQLSDIFRYILQSDRKGLVTLEDELDCIEAFRHVMEVRFANKLSFLIDVPEDKRYLRLPVLSLLPLVENVTVHNMIDGEHLMKISITLDEDLTLIVSNPIYPKLTAPDTNGTGLKNLENRFSLLLNKQIRVENDGKVFRVCLPLK